MWHQHDIRIFEQMTAQFCNIRLVASVEILVESWNFHGTVVQLYDSKKVEVLGFKSEVYALVHIIR